MNPASIRSILLLSSLWTLASAATPSTAPSLPKVGNCTVFPTGNAWNIRIDKLPIAKNSAKIVKSIGLSAKLSADFGRGTRAFYPIGIPINLFSDTFNHHGLFWFKPTFKFPNESNTHVEYPLIVTSGVEAPPHRRVIHVDMQTCTLYEMSGLQREGLHAINGESGAVWDLTKNTLRPTGWRSADMAGLPIFPALVKYEELKSGAINHALRFTAPVTRKQFVWPARHFDPNGTGGKDHPPMGLRVRLKASYNISSFPPHARVILQALKTYGMMLAEKGPAWQISGETNYAWNNPALATLTKVTGADFEVVQLAGVRQVQ